MQTDSVKRSALTVRSALLAGVLAGVLVTAIALVANVGSDAADSESRLGETLVAPTPMAQESPPSAQGGANNNSSQGSTDQTGGLLNREMPSRPRPAPLPPEVMAPMKTVVATPAQRAADEARMAEAVRNLDE